MLLDQLTGCETTLMFTLAKIFQGKYLCYFPWFSLNKKQEKKKHLSAFTVEALLPTGQANPHAVISPALNRCCLCSSCHFCCHNFVWSLIDFFSLCLVFGQTFHFQSTSQQWSIWRLTLYAGSHRAAINLQIPAMIQPHSAPNSYHLHLYLSLYVYLHYQSPFSTAVCSILT